MSKQDKPQPLSAAEITGWQQFWEKNRPTAGFASTINLVWLEEFGDQLFATIESQRAEIERKQRLMSELSCTIRGNLELMRSKYGGNVPEDICGDADAVFNLHREIGEQRAEIAWLSELIHETSKPLLTLDPGLQFEGLIDSAMDAACSEVATLRERVAKLEAERRELLGYISTTDGHTNQTPQEVEAWWVEQRAALAAEEANR